MNVFDFTNEDTGASFRARIVQYGDNLIGGMRYLREMSLIEFYERPPSTAADDNGTFLRWYPQFFVYCTSPLDTWKPRKPVLPITEKNRQQLRVWLDAYPGWRFR